MKILFVCKHNRFRSQIAEAYFKKINKNKSIQAYSAGIFIGMDIAKSTRRVAKKLGLEIKGKPKGIEEELLKQIDLLVLVADDLPESLFKEKVNKIMIWKIPDTSQSDVAGVEKISRIIIKRVDELNEILEGKRNDRTS